MSALALGQVQQLSPVDANGQPTTLGVGYAKNSKTKKVRLLRVTVGADVRTVQVMPPAGEDWSPQDEDVVAMIDSAGGLWLGVAAKDIVPPALTLNQGEKRLYSYNSSGAVQALHKLKSNGKHYIASLTAGTDLRTQLDALFSAMSSFLSDVTTFATSCEASTDATLVAAATSLAALLPSLSTAVNNAKTALDSVLDTSE